MIMSAYAITEDTFFVLRDEDGKKHSETGPAVMYADGSTEYWNHGVLHRDDDLPAVVWADGGLEWWIDGKQHRDDAPAVIFADGTLMYWTHGFMTPPIPEPSMNEDRLLAA
jgi:hypothetical protein